MHQIAFETAEDQEFVLSKGLEKHKSGAIPLEAQELGNRFKDKIKSAYIPAVSVRWIDDDVESGLFAEEDIPEGAYVGEYTGVVRRNDRRYFEPLNNYCYEYPVPDEIGRSFVVDATHGNLTRFINHSNNPNLKPIHVFSEGYYHLIFLALKPIAKGTQLFYDYGVNYWYCREPPKELG